MGRPTEWVLMSGILLLTLGFLSFALVQSLA